MKYDSLKHFERVHGKAFVFLLKKLDELLEGDHEGFESKRVQFKQSNKELLQVAGTR